MPNERTMQVVTLLRRSAIHKRLISYPRLHSLFIPGESLAYRYGVLSDAAGFIADCRSLDYGCLMALDSGLPGDDFFRRFRGKRRIEFDRIMGANSCGVSIVKRRRLVELERKAVYSHAAATRNDFQDPKWSAGVSKSNQVRFGESSANESDCHALGTSQRQAKAALTFGIVIEPDVIGTTTRDHSFVYECMSGIGTAV